MARSHGILAYGVFAITLVSILVAGGNGQNDDQCMKLATGDTPIFGLGPIQNGTYFVIMGDPLASGGAVLFRVPMDKFTCDMQNDSLNDCKLDLSEAAIFRQANNPKTDFKGTRGTFLFEAAGIGGVAKFSRTKGTFFWYPATEKANSSVRLTFSSFFDFNAYLVFGDAAQGKFAYTSTTDDHKWVVPGTYPKITDPPNSGMDIGKFGYDINQKHGQINKGTIDGGFLWSSNLVAFNNAARKVLFYRMLGMEGGSVDPHSSVSYRSFIHCDESDPSGPSTANGSMAETAGIIIAIIVCLLALLLVGLVGLFCFSKKKKTTRSGQRRQLSQLSQQKTKSKSTQKSAQSARKSSTGTGPKKAGKSTLVESKKAGNSNPGLEGTSSGSNSPIVLSATSDVKSTVKGAKSRAKSTVKGVKSMAKSRA